MVALSEFDSIPACGPPAITSGDNFYSSGDNCFGRKLLLPAEADALAVCRKDLGLLYVPCCFDRDTLFFLELC